MADRPTDTGTGRGMDRGTDRDSYRRERRAADIPAAARSPAAAHNPAGSRAVHCPEQLRRAARQATVSGAMTERPPGRALRARWVTSPAAGMPASVARARRRGAVTRAALA